MFKFETQLKKLKHEVLTEVARLAKNDEISLESIERSLMKLLRGMLHNIDVVFIRKELLF